MRLDAAYVKHLAAVAGFSSCGISKAGVSSSHVEFLNNWLKSGFNAGMRYMQENVSLRENPALLLENAKSVISVVLNYFPAEQPTDKNFVISKYALGQDYHDLMKSKLQNMLDEIIKKYPEIRARVFTDTAPVLERYFAMSSGLGYIGKNTCLITPHSGSWVFIGEIICDAESDYDSPVLINCGNCTRCVDACPVGALSEKGLNANKCISYHTIESKEKTPSGIAEKVTNQLFGCDICQDVCPHNKNTKYSTCDELQLHNAVQNIVPEDLTEISNREFNRRFKGTSLLRAGRKKIIENFQNLKTENR